jgi:hypothetical protein
MSDLFDVDGNNLDLGFKNLREAKYQIEQKLKATLQEMWTVYEPFADPDFRQGFARDIDARFWEMYLGCTLINAGKKLLPACNRKHEGGQPDLCVLEENHRIWIEAIAPDLGADGPDQILRPLPINEGGGLFLAPTRQAQLRTTSAFWTKAQKIESYMKQGVITPEDTRIIAISASRFGAYVTEQPFPMVMSALFPIGDIYITIDRETGVVVEEGLSFDPFIQRENGPIPRTAFHEKSFSDISGVIWSRIALGNLSREVRPVTYVHNPHAQVPLPTNWGVWDREFVTTYNDNELRFADILAQPLANVNEE